jgi:ribosomal protein S3AE
LDGHNTLGQLFLVCYTEYKFRQRAKKRIAKRVFDVIHTDAKREDLEEQMVQAFAQAMQQAQGALQQPQSKLGTKKTRGK